MKRLLSIISVLLVGNLAMAQAPDYDDLKILYADANYEKLVKVAEAYTLKDKSKKDVLPYIWAAKGLYKISLSGTTDEKFKNAFKDAIKFLSKGMGYDAKYNANATVVEEREFIDEFQRSVVETIMNEADLGAFKKAQGWAIKYQKITLHNVGTLYMLGACTFEDGDKAGARTHWQNAEKELANITSIDDWSEADKLMLKMGVIYSAKSLIKSRQKDAAKDLLNKVAQWFESDEDWKTQYDEIVNS